ncbi:hypothetical protein [Streptomyces formicae]|uniref:Uncharacterized protein n=1 Tax=Streptomyces formicae TaxID=1616117 RepID=A0A291QD81_9ACTN|nr:hypothetical protein [Streptomyces formicae]ATL29405.1 hypothetical protein KY5_4387c [Streptomyces formicae]
MAKHSTSIRHSTALDGTWVVKCHCGFHKYAGRNKLAAAQIAQQHKKANR